MRANSSFFVHSDKSCQETEKILTRYGRYNKINVKYYIEIITRRFCQQSSLVIFIYAKVTV